MADANAILEVYDHRQLINKSNTKSFTRAPRRAINRHVPEAHNSLPVDSADLRFTAKGRMELVKAQAWTIAKLGRQLAGHNRRRFGARS